MHWLGALIVFAVIGGMCLWGRYEDTCAAYRDRDERVESLNVLAECDAFAEAMTTMTSEGCRDMEESLVWWDGDAIGDMVSLFDMEEARGGKPIVCVKHNQQIRIERYVE